LRVVVVVEPVAVAAVVLVDSVLAQV